MHAARKNSTPKTGRPSNATLQDTECVLEKFDKECVSLPSRLSGIYSKRLCTKS